MGKPKKKGNKKKIQEQKVKPIKPLSRKEKRKAMRQVQKQTKLKYYLKKHGKIVSVEDEKKTQDNSSHLKAEIAKRQKEEVELKRQQKEKKLQKAQNKQRKRQLQAANLEEDQSIKKLEKQLKLNKRKNSSKLPASFKEDGLDYLLDVCDATGLDDLGSEEEFDQVARGEVNESDQSDDEDESIQDSDEDEENGVEDDEEPEEANESDEDDRENDDNDGDLIDDDEVDGDDEEEGENEDVDGKDAVADNDDDDDKMQQSTSQSGSLSKKSGDGFWEDIYGRTRDAEGNVVKATSSTTKYVPPALRAQAAGLAGADAAAMAKLSKQVKGALNRLAESNLHVISRQMEDLYMSHSRNLMNECLCQILCTSLVSSVLTPERLTMEHALLISILHANVGSEVGATILQNMVTKYVTLNAATSDRDDIGDKQLDNYIQIVTQMYAFQIVGHELIFDLLDQMAEKFGAKDVEMILLALRAVGFLLRKDNPSRLKTLILQVQKKASGMDRGTGQSSSLSRVQFMLEIIMAIRNNNVKKIPNYDPVHQAHLQKISKTFLRPGCSVTPLNVRLEDLLSAHTRGRWWIVGSAWEGKNQQENSANNQTGNANGSLEEKFGAKLLKLARKLRMNTDARKNLFCALMSADDYLDAFERLVKVDKAVAASATRERDTAFVLLACCLQEPVFNPFYSQVAIKLGSFDRKYRMAVQCSIWDRIRDIQNLKPSEQENLAHYTSHLIKEKLLSLTCLKIIEFSELNKILVKFIKTIIVDLLDEPDAKVRVAPFLIVAGYPKLTTFRDGLRLFMRHFMLRKASKSGSLDKSELREKLASAEAALMAGEKRLVL